MVLIIILSVSIILLSDSVYAISSGSGSRQNIHLQTLYEIANQSSLEVPHISIDNNPFLIGVNAITHTIYVVTSNNSVSVIDGENNSKIKDIQIGGSPGVIVVNDYTNKIYVANSDDNSVSVIDGENDSKIKDIQIGGTLGEIEVGLNKIYIANLDNDSVSVIDGENDSKIKDIPVGIDRSATNAVVKYFGLIGLGIDINANTIYVANSDDNSVSVIDGENNKLVAGITFQVNPFGAGHIECNRTIAPLLQQIYLYSEDKCIARPNSGFEFASWHENLSGNSTRILQVSSPTSFLDFILDFLHLKPDKPESTLNVTKFGSFTANFKELPPPIPGEYVATLFAVVISAFIGSWLTPSIIEWRRSRNQGKKLEYYHNSIKDLRKDGIIDQKDISQLDMLRNNITDDYTRGKINKDQYDKLEEEVSIKYREVFKNEIGLLDNLSKSDRENGMTKLRNSIEDAYATGKINELQYNLLINKLLGYEKSS